MRIRIETLAITALTSLALSAQGWLPNSPCRDAKVRLLGCQYSGSKLVKAQEIDANNADWSVTTRQNTELGGTEYVFTAQRSMNEVGVAVAYDRPQWSSDNYVMIPSVVYGGNRQRIVNREYATGLDISDFFRRDLALTSNPI
ncbi:MAG: hypothetical protein ACI4UL_10235, partial [Muribaculaceae bacterium]